MREIFSHDRIVGILGQGSLVTGYGAGPVPLFGEFNPLMVRLPCRLQKLLAGLLGLSFLSLAESVPQVRSVVRGGTA